MYTHYRKCSNGAVYKEEKRVNERTGNDFKCGDNIWAGPWSKHALIGGKKVR